MLTVKLDLEPGSSAGLLSGGLISSHALAAAQEALRGGVITPPDGLSADAVLGNVTSIYAITYIFGLAGSISVIELLPDVFGIDLAQVKRLEGWIQKTDSFHYLTLQLEAIE